jgi:ABC-type Mn2+/Zn2+ transport system ATPase subunit
MITKITIKNFKKLQNITFPLSQSVVIIGPNNSGKSTLFQALCLWEIGVTNYLAAYQKRDLDRKGYVTINRKDLLNSPISDARFLWRNKQVTSKNDSGGIEHIKLSVVIEGNTEGKSWICETEFTFSNAESMTCRITQGLSEINALFNGDQGVSFGFLQPMSGLATTEDKLTTGSIDRKLGEGRTAEVLRNICYDILYPETVRMRAEGDKRWEKLTIAVKIMFGTQLHKPEYIKVTGLILLEYTENGIRYDISSGGRGFLQTLLLLAYMYAHPQKILLLDEPDAHLEVIRQREAFQLLNRIADELGIQIIIASHSEVVLQEAADTSKVIALIENKATEINSPQLAKSIRKALTEIGWESFYLARLKGHVIYLEGATDFHMLLQFASKLKHPVLELLRFANVQYTSDNVPTTAINNFSTLKDMFPSLKGTALFDYLPNLQSNPKLNVYCWQKREIENYFARPNLLIKWAKLQTVKHKTFNVSILEQAMQKAITDLTAPIYLNDLKNTWWDTEKMTDNWLDKIFPEFYKNIHLPQSFYKRDYYQLIMIMQPSEIDSEINEKLDLLLKILK